MTSVLLNPVSLGAAPQAGFVANAKAGGAQDKPGRPPTATPAEAGPAPCSPLADISVGLPMDLQAARRKRWFFMLVLGAHVLGGAALMVKRHLPAQTKPAPIQVSLIMSPAPTQAPAPVPALPTPPLPKLAPLPSPVVPPLWVPALTAPAPAAAQVISNEPPAAKAPAPAVPAAPSPAPVLAVAAPAAPPAVHQIPPNAVRYLAEPRLNMPLLSRRTGEQGIVHLRILVDAQGRLKEASVKKSSGFERLDKAALEDIKSARFSPYLQQGQAVEWETTALLSYELDR